MIWLTELSYSLLNDTFKHYKTTVRLTFMKLLLFCEKILLFISQKTQLKVKG